MTPFPETFKFKTQPRGRQLEVLQETWDRTNLAFLCRPGTGKTKLGLDTAALNWHAGRIDALIVIAPDGVDRQWIVEGVPKHLDDGVPRITGNYTSSTRIRAFRKLEKDMLGESVNQLRILTMSFDGLQTPRGRKLAGDMVKKFRCMVDDDESHRTANMKAHVWKAIKPIMRAARVRRIGTGTLVRQNPFSAYGQFELMGDGLLGFSSLAAFKSMYSVMLPPDNPLVRHIGLDLAKRRNNRDANGKLVPVMVAIQAKDDDERPIYRNLGDLRQRISVHSVFLTLEDVNGKEPVVNETPRYVRLTPDQRRTYEELVQYGVTQAPGGQLTTEGSLALSIRLAQVVGGFSPSDDDPEAKPLPGGNPKLDELLTLIEELGEGKLVIWAKFTAEIRAIVAALTEKYGQAAVCEYHGRMTPSQKDASKKWFIGSTAARFFVGQQKAGGTGLDGLQGVANYMAFFSNDYPYLERLQAISRLARTDGADTVQVWDLIAQETIDEDIVKCLQTAQDVSESVLARAIVREWE